jgi:hypothetical protein
MAFFVNGWHVVATFLQLYAIALCYNLALWGMALLIGQLGL